jgi:CRP-like cAMP-binding protein
MDQTELFVLQRRDLVPFLEARPQVAIRLIEVLCAKLRRTTSMVEDVMLLNMGPRIAKMVLRLAEEHGRKRGPHIRVELKLSQRELGSHVGLARENVNRQFKQWRDEGILGLEEGCIVVYDEARLRRIADDPGG